MRLEFDITPESVDHEDIDSYVNEVMRGRDICRQDILDSFTGDAEELIMEQLKSEGKVLDLIDFESVISENLEYVKEQLAQDLLTGISVELQYKQDMISDALYELDY